MYAFTAIDPDFKPKGSRDPLGFQHIWSETGRKLIKDLSTVSGNINDFKILCFAKYFFQITKGQNDELQFLPFFLRVEQAFAYARKKFNNEASFNGNNFISKHVDNAEYKLSNNQRDCILSNQRTYGIYGKYIRPAKDMKLFEQDDFETTFRNAFNPQVSDLFERIYSNTELKVASDSLVPLAGLLERLTTEEKHFFRRHILKGNIPTHLQQKFYSFLKENNDSTNISSFNLIDFINGIIVTSNDEALNSQLIEIRNTELVLAPLSYRFTYLLSESLWSYSSLQNDPVMNQSIEPLKYSFHSSLLNELNQYRKLTGIASTTALIKRNAEVSKRRGGSPWIDQQNGKFVVYYGETNRGMSEMPENHWENSYFIQSYLRLFNAIEK
jgi:hypothetical protein